MVFFHSLFLQEDHFENRIALVKLKLRLESPAVDVRELVGKAETFTSTKPKQALIFAAQASN